MRPGVVQRRPLQCVVAPYDAMWLNNARCSGVQCSVVWINAVWHSVVWWVCSAVCTSVYLCEAVYSTESVVLYYSTVNVL